ncbi:MAG TPA: dihydrodipicolinate synthase family protein [Bacteroidota bacterium]|nr:dihydrodipicolinate synthase family protein [Bacteroidota bacterium]
MATHWAGVYSALTTKFDDGGNLDLPAMEAHIGRQIAAGVHGIIVLGSLGENGALSASEKQEVVRASAAACRGKVPLVACVAETSTSSACEFVKKAMKGGAEGFMLLPPMQYVSDERETETYLRTVASASERPVMLYNNPVSYRVDITPAMFARLADEPKFVAIKESSDDVRRISDIRSLVGDRYALFTGVDDIALESLLLGAAGWVAGLVCAFPRETVALYGLVKSRRIEEALALYRWFMPLLHLDVSTKFVQNIKLAELKADGGNERVRPPRLPLAGDERARVEETITKALGTRPALPGV